MTEERYFGVGPGEAQGPPPPSPRPAQRGIPSWEYTNLAMPRGEKGESMVEVFAKLAAEAKQVCDEMIARGEDPGDGKPPPPKPKKEKEKEKRRKPYIEPPNVDEEGLEAMSEDPLITGYAERSKGAFVACYEMASLPTFPPYKPPPPREEVVYERQSTFAEQEMSWRRAGEERAKASLPNLRYTYPGMNEEGKVTEARIKQLEKDVKSYGSYLLHPSSGGVSTIVRTVGQGTAAMQNDEDVKEAVLRKRHEAE
ncbi:hypothetical protein LTR62_001556 [Meristemomyces frigidus]|uniref:Uncharacterized protein n=1 Tax=Meristemomyces frigidus TaxID=1508187 RepID=A0AAN7YI24_9PEZI|nr:hypothetical protein LTR62_001556 [Meristemomyces frigidus]